MLTVSGRFSATCVTAVSCERGEGVAETSRQLRNLLPPFHTFSIIAMFSRHGGGALEVRGDRGDRARRSWRPAVAHHEAGHAVMARFLGHDVHFATIRPDPSRNSLGHTRTSASARAIAATKRADGKQHGRLLGRTCSRLCTSVGPALSPSGDSLADGTRAARGTTFASSPGFPRSSATCVAAFPRRSPPPHGCGSWTCSRNRGSIDGFARWPQDCSPSGQ